MFFFKTRKKKHSDECIFKTEKKRIVASKIEGAHFQNSNKMTPHFELLSGKCL